MKRTEGKLKKGLAAGIFLTGGYVCLDCFARAKKEKKDIDRDNEYVREEPSWSQPSFYEKLWKRFLDKGLSFLGLLVLAPVYGIISLAIYADDPGPVFFIQKRVGKDKHYFELHKFRSMKISAPHDTPTHQLRDPDQYITRVGKILRRTSLDELPQIWDIFRGKMSIIGPRPALWNQADLVAEREKYGANSIFPGLTGLAQIRGRDELEIPDKASLDGEYASRLREGGAKAFIQDVKCFIATIYSVVCHAGVIEGECGEKRSVSMGDADTWPVREKKILIAGAGSYIGEALKNYLAKTSDKYKVDMIDTVEWKPVVKDFVGYDVIINVSGIAHIKETNENRSLYYEVNRDLAINMASAGKKAGVGQFIQLSSMSVYGMTTGAIDKKTVPYPITAYGESKLAADEAIESMEDKYFKVTILRPPVVYGKNCKGNYQLLRRFALRSPVFPKCKNKRSMIFIGNLCEFVKRLIDREACGIFFPQNREYVNTGDMVKYVAEANGRRIRGIPVFPWAVKLSGIRMMKKVFGDLIYEKVDMVGKYDFEETIKMTEQ